MTAIDRKLVAALEGDLPAVPRPFAELARRSGTPGVSEESLLAALRGWLEQGIVRRYGALVAHRALGYSANAMIVWQAPEDRIEEIGQALAGHSEVTHCYQRPPFPGFPYNLYAMVHGRSRQECEEIARRLSEQVGLEDYRILFSTREFKKASPSYG
jgi:DNA-binding Lrp family transcriptional regulator